MGTNLISLRAVALQENLSDLQLFSSTCLSGMLAIQTHTPFVLRAPWGGSHCPPVVLGWLGCGVSAFSGSHSAVQGAQGELRQGKHRQLCPLNTCSLPKARAAKASSTSFSQGSAPRLPPAPCFGAPKGDSASPASTQTLRALLTHSCRLNTSSHHPKTRA